MLWHMATPRSQLVDPDHALFYHIGSGCVRGAWLCGLDQVTGRDYSYRKAWFEERLYHLAQYFAIELYAFVIMSNHFHLIVYYDPLAGLAWSDVEVVKRWLGAFPPKRKTSKLKKIRAAMLKDPEKIAKCRAQLGSLSAFMQNLKQPIAWRANKEDGVRGHFFEDRFYSGALLSEEAVLASMAYVDLNPIRAKITQSIEQCEHTSIRNRLQALENSAERLEQWLHPLVSGLEQAPHEDGAKECDDAGNTPHQETPAHVPAMTLESYIEHLQILIAADDPANKKRLPPKKHLWIQRVTSLKPRQRAYGNDEQLRAWASKRGFRSKERPLDAAPSG